MLIVPRADQAETQQLVELFMPHKVAPLLSSGLIQVILSLIQFNYSSAPTGEESDMTTQWWPTADASTVAPVEDHDDLRDAVRTILEDMADHAAIREAAASAQGYSPDAWSALAEDLGLASIAIAEEAGGLGFSLREIAVLLEETGAALLPEPVVASAIVSARALAPMIEEDTFAGLLDGSTVSTAWLGEGKATGLTAQNNAGTWSISGTAEGVQFADTAQLAVVTADTDSGEGVFVVVLSADGITWEEQESLDLTRKMFQVSFDLVPATRLDTVGGPDAHTLRQLRTVAVAAEHTGMIAHLLNTTREYLLQREQFGRKLGSFQAIKHRMADILVDLERARSATQYAAAIFDSAETGERELAAHIAGAVCQEAVLKTAYEAVQLNGGIGFTWEHEAHYYLRRALGDEALYGSADIRRDHIASLLLN